MQSDAAIFASEPEPIVAVDWGDAFGVPVAPAGLAGADAPDPLHDATNDEASAMAAYRKILNHFSSAFAL
jgi:hypothetical protein